MVATQLFLKVLVKKMIDGKPSIGDALIVYHQKMTGCAERRIGKPKKQGVPDTIKSKYRLLLNDDPVERLKEGECSALNRVLANTHFMTPGYTLTTTDCDGKKTEEHITVDREVAREMIRKKVTQLWQNPETQHVIEALGVLIAREKGHVFIGTTPMNNNFAANYSLNLWDHAGTVNVMHVEAIVRPMEQIAQGVPPEAVKKVAPNLWKFYQEHSKVLLENYVKESA